MNVATSANTLQANQLKSHWLPFTANRHFYNEPRLLVRAEGMHYWTNCGDKVLDGISGLFCCALGHGRPEIAEAVAKQMASLDFAPPFQFATPQSFDLAQLIASITPGDLNWIFFANSGSEAVESAMKAALLYHRQRGQPQRQRFVGRARAYHGVNLGGLSLGGMVRNREAFGLGLPGVAHLRHTWLEENRFARGQGEAGGDLALELQEMVDLHGADSIAACFVEPIAGSTGVLVPPKNYLQGLRAICDRHGILLVFDEVICGFGRTGKAFGADSFGVTPDILTMAKALTNGAVPMGAMAVSEKIYETVVGATPVGGIEFPHGYTYSAHPAACAAGIAVQKIYREEAVFDRAAALSPYFLDAVYGLRDLPVVQDIRGYGLLAGIDLAPGRKPGERGFEALRRLFEAGLVVRMTQDTLILAPALVAERTHIDELVDLVRGVLGGY